MQLLETIHDPKDLKQLTPAELLHLAEEIRQFLIEGLSFTGGHLASNLGVVELTIALHYFYNSPHDKLIFDVGHQAYVHKILTGRLAQFTTLRQKNGLCGFIKRSESVHDIWEAGHSSTSLSAAVGMAISRDLQAKEHRIISIIGDGALTGGMALEALNYIGHVKRKLIVILNDNEMSIAPNVGAIHNYLTKIRTEKFYHKTKDELEWLLKKIPAIGGKLANSAERVKDSLKYLLAPQGVLFEEFGLKYLGPVDGHNIMKLVEIFKKAEKLKGSVLIHVLTTKGKGYLPAENDAHKWHGVSGPYKIESGQLGKPFGPPMYTEVFSKTLVQLAEQDSRIVAVTPAMPGGSGLGPFAKKFPDRMFDVGIAEQHAATMCGALASTGLKPVYAVYSTFLQRAYDQVLHDICRQNLNVIFAIDRAGFVGADGETHQGAYDIAYLRHIPHLVIMMPKDENELRSMLHTAVAYDKGPIAVRYSRIKGTGIKPIKPQLLPIGRWDTTYKGDYAAVIALGPMVQIGEQAAQRLKRQGIEIRVINARFIKPLDKKMLMQLAKEQLPLVIMEEGSIQGGLGSAILEFYALHHIQMKVRLMGASDQFIAHASVEQQREMVGLTMDNLIKELLTFQIRKRQKAT